MCRADRQERWSGLASVRLVGVGSITVVACRKARALLCFGLCSFGQRGLSHRCSLPKVKCVGLFSPLLLCSAWAQAMRWRADRQGRWFVLVSVSLVGVGLVIVVASL
jgi:hypothetical protein